MAFLKNIVKPRKPVMQKLTFIFLLLSLQLMAQTKEKLTPEMLFKMARVNNPQLSPDGKKVAYEVKRYDLASNKGTNFIYIMDAKGGNPIQVSDDKNNAFDMGWRPDGKKITYLSGESGSTQVWEMNADGSEKTQVTTVEGGVNAYKYAPSLTHIAYAADVKLEQTPAEIYPDLPQTKARIIDGLFYRHWDSWHDYAYSHMFIVSYSNGKTGSDAADIMKDEKFDAPLQPFGGSEQFNWSTDGKKLAYTSRKLNGTSEALSTNSNIYIYNVDAKNTVTLTDDNMGYDVNPAFSPDGKKIAWQSMKRPSNEADKNRLMVYYFDEKKTIEVTEAFDYPLEQFQWNNSNQLYFIAEYQGTRNIFSSEEKNPKTATFDKVKPVTEGDHDYVGFSMRNPDKKTFVLIGAKQHMSLPTELFSISNKGIENQVTFTNKALTDNISWGRVEKRMIPSTDGKQILTWVIYPPNFNPAKQYPTLLYCQGGPQSMVSQFFSYRWNFQLMANNGYIIVAPNRRGVPGFGQEWTDQIIGDYGGQCMKDYLSAIDEVSKENFVAKDRRGAVGASFGGFSVYWLAGNHQNRFKTFVAHCGMFNMESWYGSTEEMWFANTDSKGAYWQSPKPKNYDSSPNKFVQNWNTPILVIHNEKDFRVPLTQGMEAFTAAQLKGIKSRFLYFPDENHWVTKPQNSVLWQRVYFDWLDTYLK
jgi:dipeptidyl aminopeptidase/acylaminoacyl peptidase